MVTTDRLGQCMGASQRTADNPKDAVTAEARGHELGLDAAEGA
jgi:hypothetical protein